MSNLPYGMRPVDNGVFVAGQIKPDNVEALAAEGCKTIICNRPDNEGWGQPSSDQIRAEAEKHGIAFHYIPVGHGGVTADMVAAMRKALSESDGVVLAYCRSGARSAHMCAFSKP
ncbi:TIGR01244 family sulfur transferase [Oricola sp.]|uniref:TIGR01244 family sulfur transferase n=1 Tax=Oricola sp. TaxID=1979950 RepID=UPI0025F1D49E|nr:TIGR01244 family sulfur transferase [Oricola sp.]MCI5078543.1 TIGR01244 family sulfur transferase [Oricola sp.]